MNDLIGDSAKDTYLFSFTTGYGNHKYSKEREDVNSMVSDMTSKGLGFNEPDMSIDEEPSNNGLVSKLTKVAK